LDISPRKLNGFGQNLAEGWEMEKEWLRENFGKIAAETPEKRAKYQHFSS